MPYELEETQKQTNSTRTMRIAIPPSEVICTKPIRSRESRKKNKTAVKISKREDKKSFSVQTVFRAKLLDDEKVLVANMAADRDKVNLPEGTDKTDRKTFRQINHFNGPTCVHEWTLTHSTHERCSRAVQKVKEPPKTTKTLLSNPA
ncbi:hypothetical protein RUM44_008762 [Polyplax serrata]|uniref:Uncharacterized protein n=1 Tax=Polyplax serrata TaxID=468196 RepID=A0ABR1B963_POLSC